MNMLFAFVFVVASFVGPDEAETSDHSYARIQTSMGNIDIELLVDDAPVTTRNFLDYAKSGYYDRLVFHRVVPNTLIQGGGYSASLFPRATRDPIVNEASNGLSNLRGTVAMARYADPDSATSQFFINLADNTFLDRTGDEFRMDAGYAVFGRVVAGMDVADSIGDVPTGDGQGADYFPAEVPQTAIIIRRIDPIDHSEVGVAAE